jgi:hypothetical protein
MTSHYEQITKGIKGMLIVSLGIVVMSSCAKMCSRPEPAEYADPTPIVSEYPNLPYLQHQALGGLYLTVTENQDNKRKINFFDYGFDGRLDRVRVNQNNMREYVITNSEDLVKWQPLFEQMRFRRFGDYEKCDKNFN